MMRSVLWHFDGVFTSKGGQSMDAKEAQCLRKEWFGKPCSHLQIEKEEKQGREMNEYVCLICGSEFGSRKVWEKLLHTRELQSINSYSLLYKGMTADAS
jgi:DNA-directed RNA polymerase subunit RPC12/RpoP